MSDERNPVVGAGETVTAEEAARELWAALVVEWNGYDDATGDLPLRTFRRVSDVIAKHRDRFGTDDAFAALFGSTHECDLCGQTFPHYHRDGLDGDELVRLPAEPSGSSHEPGCER